MALKAAKESTLVPLTGLWEAKGADGKRYLSGTLGKAKVLVFRNSYKTEEKHPDFIIYLAPASKPDDDKGKRRSKPEDDVVF